MTHILIKGKIILSGCLIVNDRKEILLLYRKDHKHYETPGGKVDEKECSNPQNPSLEDLARTAEREVYEELGNEIKIEKLKYFGKVEFTVPDGRTAIANKFITQIVSGRPKINERQIFSRLDYLPISRLSEYPISPDLKLFLLRLKEELS